MDYVCCNFQGSSMACTNSYCSIPSADPTIPEPEHGSTSTSSLLQKLTSPTVNPFPPQSMPSLTLLQQIHGTPAPKQLTTSEIMTIATSPTNICFDYTGVGLSSHSELSSAAQSFHLQPSFFKIACKSVTLKSGVPTVCKPKDSPESS